MFMALELPVIRLIRTDFGPISIGELKEGRWRNLNEGELIKLFTDLKLKR
jgi:23S rRNA pseudouridine2605 synthase